MLIASPLTDELQGWGTVAGASVGLLALIAALAAYVIQAKQLRTQQTQLKDQQKLNEQQSKILELQAEELRASIADRRRFAAREHQAQASLVFLATSYAESYADRVNTYHWSAVVENKSELPIYEVSARWVEGTPKGIKELHGADNHAFHLIRRLEPGKRHNFEDEIVPEIGPLAVEVLVTFRDANGAWWEIDEDGLVKESDGRRTLGMINLVRRAEQAGPRPPAAS